jgi:DNA-binding beta-propeller fold protein YncE
VRRGWLSVFATLAIGCVWLAAPLHAQFVYVANAGGNNVWAYSIAADGFLVPVPGSPFAVGREPDSVAVDPTGKFAYVANTGDANNVSAYRIAADGALKPVPGSPFAAGSRPVSVAVDPTGKFAYVANNLDNNVSAYSIAANGALTQVPGSPFATGSRPVSMAVDPTGKFAYVAHARVNTGWAYHIAANGGLTPVLGSSPFPTWSFPVSVAMGPTGKYFYVVTSRGIDSRGDVGVNLIADGGFVVPIHHFATGIQPSSMAVDPTGKFAYVAIQIGDIHSLNGSVSAYRIAANGDLTPVPGSPFATGFGPTSVAITPLVPFASSLAELEIAKDRFDLKESFTLGTNSNGINPVKENVTLQIGTFSVMIPAGSFFRLLEGGFAFEGVINGVTFEVQIVPLGNNIFTFKAVGTDVDLTGLTKPVTVVLTIGINSGATTVIIPSF